MTKKLYLIFLIFLTLYSCKISTTKDQKHKDSKEEFSSREFKKLIGDENLELINLDSLSGFSALRTKVEKLTCEEKISGITFKLEDKRYNLIGYSECNLTRKTQCKDASSFIFVKNDSIITNLENNDRIHISRLHDLLSKIESNNYIYKISDDKDSPIIVYLDINNKKTMAVTKNVLKEIIVSFDDLNANKNSNFQPYNILLDEYTIGNN